MNLENYLNEIPMLTAEERQSARDKACELIQSSAGRKPDPKDFENRRLSPYPRWIEVTTLFLLVVLFIAAFLPSAFRLYHAGQEHFLTGMPDATTQAIVAGGAVVLLAEILVILATIVQRVYFHSGDMRILNFGIILGVLIALFGNVVVAKPPIEFSADAAFAWLETVAPSIVVFIASTVLKQIMFTSLEHRAQNIADYHTALEEWESQTGDPEDHPNFLQRYGNTLKDAITSKYVKGRNAQDRREYVNSLTRHHWIELVKRELLEDRWMPSQVVYDDVEMRLEDGSRRAEVDGVGAPFQPQYAFKKQD